MDGNVIVSRIKAKAAEKGIPMQDVYEQSDVTSGAVSQWKHGKTTPTIPALTRIANTLGTTVSDLLGEPAEYPKTIANISTVYVVADSATAQYLERVRQEYPELNVEKFRTLEELKATVAYLQALRGQK